MVLRYHSAYGFSRNTRRGPDLTNISWMSGTLGAHPGTEYGPQCRKTPSLASSYQSGTAWVRTDSHVPSYMVVALSHHLALAEAPSCGGCWGIVSPEAIPTPR